MPKHKPYNDELLVLSLARGEEASAVARLMGLTAAYVRRIARGAARADLQPRIRAIRNGVDQELVRLALPFAKAVLARHVKLGLEGTNETARKCREFVLHFATASLHEHEDRMDDLAEQVEQEQAQREKEERARAKREQAIRDPGSQEMLPGMTRDDLAVIGWAGGSYANDVQRSAARTASGTGPEDRLAAGLQTIPQPDGAAPGQSAPGGAAGDQSAEEAPYDQSIPGVPPYVPGWGVVLDLPGLRRQYLPVAVARRLGMIPRFKGEKFPWPPTEPEEKSG